MLTNLTESIKLARDCPGTLIPAGDLTVLPAGSVVTIKQELGGDFTVRTDCGDLVRIIGENADALGREPQAPASALAHAEGPFQEEWVWDQLRTIYDPEIPVDIVELGLVYDVYVQPHPPEGQKVEIRMTLTAPGCGMGDVLKRDVERKVSAIPGVQEVQVDIVFDPPWSPAAMSDAARLQLGFF